MDKFGEDVDLVDSELLACSCCGCIQEKPFAENDQCPMCGYGKLELYFGQIKYIGGLKFSKASYRLN